jgi:hypothetical protein
MNAHHEATTGAIVSGALDLKTRYGHHEFSGLEMIAGSGGQDG